MGRLKVQKVVKSHTENLLATFIHGITRYTTRTLFVRSVSAILYSVANLPFLDARAVFTSSQETGTPIYKH